MEKTHEIIKSELINIIICSPGMSFASNYLIELKKIGIDAKTAIDILNEILTSAKNGSIEVEDLESFEDGALEILDIATGFCSPQFVVW